MLECCLSLGTEQQNEESFAFVLIQSSVQLAQLVGIGLQAGDDSVRQDPPIVRLRVGAQRAIIIPITHGADSVA